MAKTEVNIKIKSYIIYEIFFNNLEDMTYPNFAIIHIVFKIIA